MKASIALLATILGIFSLLETGLSRRLENQSSCCEIVQNALRDSMRITIGMKRRTLGEHWKLDGGAQVRGEERYTYAGCSYIRVDIDFKLAAPAEKIEGSPDDTVSKVSKPYIAYPTSD